MLNFFKRLFDDTDAASEPGTVNGAIVLDVRLPSEFEEGHIHGSRNIPISEIKSKVEMIRRWNRPVITVCRSGARSAVAQSVLAAAGIEVYNGGAWTNLRN